MRILIEFVLTVAAAFLAVKYGGVWPVILVLAYLALLALKVPSFARQLMLSWRFLAFAGIYFVTAVFIGWVILGILQELHTELGSSDRTYIFLANTTALKTFWAVVGGALVTAMLAVMVLVPYGYLTGDSMYRQYPGYRGHEREAALRAMTLLIGLDQGVCVISQGKAEFSKGNAGSLALFGGPGILVAQEGHAAILEQSGRLSRVVGRGITFLKPFERLSMAAPLYTRTEHVVVEHVATKDRIIIREFEFWLFHKIDPGQEEMQTENGQYPYNEENLLRNVWTPNGGDWRNGIKSVAETSARDVVGRYNLEQIVPISGPPRVTFKEALVQEINRVAKGFMGLTIVAVDVGKVELPEEAERKLRAKWLADWDIRIAQSEREAIIRKGEAEAVILKIKEVAWAEAQRHVIEEITRALQNLGDITGREQAAYCIALRSLETLEKMAGDPATKILLPTEIVAQIHQMRQMVGTVVGQELFALRG
jgi:regulator of protease activity HflC (stomatin/prohibitin superfamily)